MHGDHSASAETRKLQKVGGGTYTVSVPKEWATEQSLSAGETVHLYPDADGSLVLCRDDDRGGPASATIPLATGDGDSLGRTLRAAYAAGVERLTLASAGEDGFADGQRRRIDRLVRSYTGMRVVEEREDAVTIQTILDDGEVSIQRTVVQLQFTTLSLFRTAVDLALDPSTSGEDRIDERRADARRLASLVTRQFGRSLSRPATAVDLGVDRPTAFDCYRTAEALGRLAGLAADVGRASGDGRPDGETADALRSVAAAVRRYVEEATTAVVDGHALASEQDLRATRAELSALTAEADAVLEEEHAARRHLRQFESCAACGDRIADVARQAAVRREN